MRLGGGRGYGVEMRGTEADLTDGGRTTTWRLERRTGELEGVPAGTALRVVTPPAGPVMGVAGGTGRFYFTGGVQTREIMPVRFTELEVPSSGSQKVSGTT